MLATWAQIKAHFWLRRRVGYGLTLRNVSMQFDLAGWVRSMPAIAAALLLVVCGGAYVFSMIRPAGQIGDSRIVQDRGSGTFYVNANGRLYPALNLSSARLIAGTFVEPTQVGSSAISGRPQGPRVGIPGAPDQMGVTNGDQASVAVCQRVPVESVTGHVVVTVLDGGLVLGARADRLTGLDALLGTMNGQTYLVWNGVKSAVDPSDRVVLSALGIDRDALLHARPLAPAFGNAVPSALPLVDPVIPDAGTPVPWNLGVPVVVGSVVQADIPGRGQRFYVVLKDGVQEVPASVASMVRSENAFGATSAPAVAPDALAAVPQVTIVQTSQYPPRPVHVVAGGDKPVSCWTWEKGRTATSATMSVVAGTELPIAAGADAAVTPVVSAHDGVNTADAVYMAAGAANWVVATGNSQSASTQESLWWLSASGSRFGVEASSRDALGLGQAPLSLPWTVLRLFPSGLPAHVALSKADALLQHENIPVDPAPGALQPR
ncbi:type VII secretion system ESX-5 subunit EccB5 [Mycobacterium avium subsp. hominissuis]